MINLKPCPLCGGKAYAYSDGWRVWWGVQCYTCLHKIGEYRSEKKATNEWNRRATDE